MRWHRATASIALVAATACTGSSGELTWEPCPDIVGHECAAPEPSVRLIRRAPSGTPILSTIVILAGGPGQLGRDVAPEIVDSIAARLPTSEILLVDDRSSLIDPPSTMCIDALEGYFGARLAEQGAASDVSGTCHVGASIAAVGLDDRVADLGAVLDAIDRPVLLVGVSYGAVDAIAQLGAAGPHPASVLLDSPVSPFVLAARRIDDQAVAATALVRTLGIDEQQLLAALDDATRFEALGLLAPLYRGDPTAVRLAMERFIAGDRTDAARAGRSLLGSVGDGLWDGFYLRLLAVSCADGVAGVSPEGAPGIDEVATSLRRAIASITAPCVATMDPDPAYRAMRPLATDDVTIVVHADDLITPRSWSEGIAAATGAPADQLVVVEGSAHTLLGSDTACILGLLEVLVARLEGDSAEAGDATPVACRSDQPPRR
jgi:pimeloyl-ACP methyl ester carboxylesterase